MSSNTAFDLLILDYGGVYSFEYELGSFDAIMQNTFGKVPDAREREQIEYQSHRLAAGQVSSGQYVLDVARILKVQIPSPEVFEDNTIAVTHDPSPEMVKLVSQVKQAGINVTLLSNMYLFEVAKTKPSGRYDGFDYVAFSAEAQLTKSDPEFFLRSINHFNANISKTLFVDDIVANVETAEQLGINTIHADKNKFASAEALANSIREMLQI